MPSNCKNRNYILDRRNSKTKLITIKTENISKLRHKLKIKLKKEGQSIHAPITFINHNPYNFQYEDSDSYCGVT